MADPHSIARLAAQAHGSLADHALLDRFAAARDEAAFAALVERHGPVVLDAARAVLRHAQDAEDVFQAAFLVLARKAGSIRKPDALACWLHGVARRLALKAHRARTRRWKYEAAVRPEPATGDDLTWAEVRALVHDELARLPETLRAPVLLCHLEGLTLDDAAARLGLPRGTLRKRLDRGREVLRRRLARRGLAAAALAFPASVSRAVSPLLVLGTARSAIRFAAGVAEPTRAATLAQGALSPMFTTRITIGLLVVALGGIGLAAIPGATTEPSPQREEAAPLAAAREPRDEPPAAQPSAAAKVEFEELSVTVKHGGPTNRTPETIRVTADGKCVYVVKERPARGNAPAWPPAAIVHKLPPARLHELNELLKGTDWLAKDPKEKMQLHQDEYEVTLKRDGKTVRNAVKGESAPYEKLVYFFRSLSAQEYLEYQLEWVPEAHNTARVELDSLVSAELRDPAERPYLAIDLNRFVPWATRIVRNHFEEQTEDVRSAVRLVGVLKLESEREFLSELANDRDRGVRVDVAEAVGRLGGEKAVPVLRKMLRGTGAEAAWVLIKLGPIAVPAIVEVIRNGTDPQDRGYEWLIRAYIDHWKQVPRPLHPDILDAVKVSMAAPKVKADRTQYHAELLKLAAAPPPPDGPKVMKARTDVRNLAIAAGAYKVKTGMFPTTLKDLQTAGFVDPAAELLDPWGRHYRYDPKGKRSGGTRPDVWVVTPEKEEVGSWAAELWGVWVVRSAAADEKKQVPSGGHWEFHAGVVGIYQSNNVYHRCSSYTVDASKEPKQIDLVFAGKPMKGIYEVKGDTLRVCHTLGQVERPKDFEGGPGVVVWVFDRQKD